MKSRGRPALKPSITVILWVFVELMRDTQGNRPPLKARSAAKRLASELRTNFPGGRVLPAETIRHHHKKIEQRLATGGDEITAEAIWLLALGRQQRWLLGWDTSVWLLFNATLVSDTPVVLPFKGYDIEIQGHKIVAHRQH